jgi:hypothetical protein
MHLDDTDLALHFENDIFVLAGRHIGYRIWKSSGSLKWREDYILLRYIARGTLCTLKAQLLAVKLNPKSHIISFVPRTTSGEVYDYYSGCAELACTEEAQNGAGVCRKIVLILETLLKLLRA